MKIPKHFKHKGKRWRVIFEDDLTHEDGTKCDGLCDSTTRTIFIEKALDEHERLAAYIHETFHVIVTEAHIVSDCKFSEEVEDIIAEAYTDMLINTFKINRKQSK